MSDPLRIALIVGEVSGDALAAGLMRNLRDRLGEGGVTFHGVGGEAMAAEGLTSPFPLSDLAVMGFTAVAARLPRLVRRVYEAVDAVAAGRPDALVIVDSPDFTHAVAKRVRHRLPGLPVVNYVSPSVWAWRPGRARAMRAYVDHVLALLPFEPEAYRRLGGPPCTYVGHPLAERLDELTPGAADLAARADPRPDLLVLPGSRGSEVRRLLPVFGRALDLLRARGLAFRPVLPTVAHVAERVRGATAGWAEPPVILAEPAAKAASFRRARAALAASGTVTLELAMAGVPTVAAYRVGAAEAAVARRLIKVSSVLLPNLILGRNAVPELLQGDCTPERLADALEAVWSAGEGRAAQAEALAQVRARVAPPGPAPSALAATVLLGEIVRRR